MSGKASKAMIAMMLGSLVLIFGTHLSLYPSVAKAFGDAPVAVEQEDDGDVLKLAMDMKLAEKDLEALVKNEANRARFFDPSINMGLIDRDLLVKLMVMQRDLLDEVDESMAEPVDEEEKDVDLEDPDDMDVEDEEDMDVEDEEDVDVDDVEDMDVEEPEDMGEVEDQDVKHLDDEELMKMAMEMKAMEKKMEDLLKSGDSSGSLFFDQVSDKGLIDRPLLVKLLLLRQDLLDAFDTRDEED